MSEKHAEIVKLLKARQEAEKIEDFVEYEKLSQQLFTRLAELGDKEEVLTTEGDFEVIASGMSVIMEKGKEPRMEPRLHIRRKEGTLSIGNTLFGKKQGEI